MGYNLEYGRHFGKYDLERIGLFAEMEYMNGKGYVSPFAADKKDSRIKGLQMIVGGPKVKTGLQDCYFDQEFRRIFEKEAWIDPVKLMHAERYDEPEALCMCKETEVACGSNNRTYDSVCHMNQERSRTGHSIYLKHLGPCRSEPWVTSGPEDESGALHQPLALDCEAKGYPIPSIQWEFKANDGSTRVLPSDDQYVAVQVRGGPEPFMVTSWVQIVDLRHTDTGTYTCVASNSEGSARASARVGIRG